MKAKPLVLIFLVIFCLSATSTAFGLPSAYSSEGTSAFLGSYSTAFVESGRGLEPHGDPVGTPGGPTNV